MAARATKAPGWGILADVALATTLVIFWRLWDDLEDLPADRERHPYRVLVLARSTTPFVWLTVGLGVGAALLMLVTRSSWVLLQFGLLCLVTAAWYRLGRRRVHGVLAYHVVLLKYPAIVLMVAQRMPAAERREHRFGSLLRLRRGLSLRRLARRALRRAALVGAGIGRRLRALLQWPLGHYLKLIAPLGVFS